MTRMKWLALAALAAGLGGCGALRRPDPVLDTSQDPRIRREIESRITAEPSLAASTLRVEVSGGTVMLRGTVQGMGAWQCAISNAELVDGVRTVVDFLVLERGPRDVRCLAPPAPATGRGADPATDSG